MALDPQEFQSYHRDTNQIRQMLLSAELNNIIKLRLFVEGLKDFELTQACILQALYF